MARKTGTPKKAGDGSIDKAKFNSIMGRARNIKANMDESRGELGALIKDAEETHGIHRGAFKLAVKLKGMEPEKRADYLRAFDNYRELADLDDQPDMLDRAEEAQPPAMH